MFDYSEWKIDMDDQRRAQQRLAEQRQQQRLAEQRLAEQRQPQRLADQRLGDQRVRNNAAEQAFWKGRDKRIAAQQAADAAAAAETQKRARARAAAIVGDPASSVGGGQPAGGPAGRTGENPRRFGAGPKVSQTIVSYPTAAITVDRRSRPFHDQWRHPTIHQLVVEVTPMGSDGLGVGIDWHPYGRVLVGSADLKRRWTQHCRPGRRFPLELRRTSSASMELRLARLGTACTIG
jgi:hypothetical protein